MLQDISDFIIDLKQKNTNCIYDDLYLNLDSAMTSMTNINDINNDINNITLDDDIESDKKQYTTCIRSDYSSTIDLIKQKMSDDCQINYDQKDYEINATYYVNDIVKKYLRTLYEETMLKKYDMNSNVSVIFDPIKGYLIVEYIGYKGTDFYTGQYFILIELPIDYPNSPPHISVLTESGRFKVKCHLSMSISQYHRETWYPMPLTFLIINIISAFPDYEMNGIGHIHKKIDDINISIDIKNLVEKTREYNEIHNPIYFSAFKKIQEIKDTGSDVIIMKYIDEMMSECE